MHLYEECPKFAICSAPVCPMHDDWLKLSHLRGERVCLYLREWSKVGGEAAVRERLRTDMAEAVALAYQRITLADAHAAVGHGELRRVLRASAQTGSMLAAGRRLRKQPVSIPI